jgi:anion-transporting  ArsA/GET3 family ATPase
MSTLGEVLASAEVIICCGSGGVGKTTTAAVIGLEQARLGRRVVVVTIDPAKRLADALGLHGELGNDPTLLSIEGTDGGGELWATMLDPAATFDDIVRQTAPTPERAEQILANRFYRNISGSLSGTQEYMAAERLNALHHDSRFDVVVVDTSPSREALDFLEAPATLTRFLDHPVFKLLMLPARRGLGVLNVAAQPVLRSIGKVVGGAVLADAIAFFHAFEGMEAGFRERAAEVMGLLRSPASRYVLIASPKRDTVDEARYFADRLEESSLQVSALVVNRSTPRFGMPTAARRAKNSPLWINLDELAALSAAEHDHLRDLVAHVGDAPVVWVPLLADDVHDLEGLHRVQTLLFGTTTADG